ncbi:MAG: hypothetical protein IK999_10740, partial [Ruminococcus sp.]|nr:hypothetical protein [Ruminococcus sp.]
HVLFMQGFFNMVENLSHSNERISYTRTKRWLRGASLVAFFMVRRIIERIRYTTYPRNYYNLKENPCQMPLLSHLQGFFYVSAGRFGFLKTLNSEEENPSLTEK